MPDSFSLDSRAVLGLLSKVHQVFSSDGVTLAFPLGAPVPFDAAELSAAMGPGPDGPAHALLAQFSQMMNWVPDGPVWPPAAPRQLDDIVRSVLNEGVWAAGDRTPEEETRFAQAQALVSMTNPVMQEYLALRDAWIRSCEQARNTPDDAHAQEAEHQAEAAMVAYPHREEIERAKDDLLALDARAPYRTRQQMQAQIDVGIGTFDNPSVGKFSPVRPMPKEVIQAENWDRVSLDAADLEALAASAPQELLDHLTVPDEGDTTVSITFEYASAQVHRQWLDERLFQLRCWHFADDDRVLSDGGDPPSGECPSYVRAIVLARNVAVTRKVPPDVPAPPPVSEASEPSSMELLLPNQARLEMMRSLVLERAVVDEPHLVPTTFEAAVVLPAAAVMEPAPEVAVTEPAVGTTRFIGRPRFDVRATDVGARPEPVTLVSAPDLSALILEEAQRAPDFQMVFQPTIQLPVPEPAVEPGLMTETTPPGRVILLALICKNIGRSPDPNPSFHWDP